MGKGNDSAYPVQWHMDGQLVAVPGLTKREYFAGLAMQGLLARSDNDMMAPEQVASDAKHYADALLTALERSHDGG